MNNSNYTFDKNTDIKFLKSVGPKRAQALYQNEINTVSDILKHYPRKYLDRTSLSTIGSINEGEEVNLVGRVKSVNLRRMKKGNFVTANVADHTGSIRLMWFNAADYIHQSLKVGDLLAMNGKVAAYKGSPQIVHPEYDKLNANEISIGEISFEVMRKGKSDRHYIWLHGDEKTAKMALNDHMSTKEGKAFFIQSEAREVVVAGGLIDPNRIFSSEGAKKNLHKYNPNWSNKKKSSVLNALEESRESFLNTIFPQNGGLLIALHNNFKGYNVYQEISKSDTVSIKKNQNPRDFFLCTNREDFDILSSSPYNVVLQESYPENDDGSLSWAALKWGVRYVNIETRLGWLSMQKKMLKYANENLP